MSKEIIRQKMNRKQKTKHETETMQNKTINLQTSMLKVWIKRNINQDMKRNQILKKFYDQKIFFLILDSLKELFFNLKNKLFTEEVR